MTSTSSGKSRMTDQMISRLDLPQDRLVSRSGVPKASKRLLLDRVSREERERQGGGDLEPQRRLTRRWQPVDQEGTSHVKLVASRDLHRWPRVGVRKPLLRDRPECSADDTGPVTKLRVHDRAPEPIGPQRNALKCSSCDVPQAPTKDDDSGSRAAIMLSIAVASGVTQRRKTPAAT